MNDKVTVLNRMVTFFLCPAAIRRAAGRESGHSINALRRAERMSEAVDGFALRRGIENAPSVELAWMTRSAQAPMDQR
jgi:hypothetical protein